MPVPGGIDPREETHVANHLHVSLDVAWVAITGEHHLWLGERHPFGPVFDIMQALAIEITADHGR